jgi:hypothetical protein
VKLIITYLPCSLHALHVEQAGVLERGKIREKKQQSGGPNLGDRPLPPFRSLFLFARYQGTAITAFNALPNALQEGSIFGNIHGSSVR